VSAAILGREKKFNELKTILYFKHYIIKTKVKYIKNVFNTIINTIHCQNITIETNSFYLIKHLQIVNRIEK